ncbi:hypothetical protein ABN763_08765 [Spongiivirga sp. MCCC 1A20706]|uniref:hypothetical protein n=1 Tax=Spongiivirga sp. MCCC 1A20706 TaxID=3160963 RepID=UPI003977C513
MKTLLPTAFLLLISLFSYSQACDDASSQASYAYSHTKKAYDSNNRDHLTQASERAYEAFVNTRDAAEKCGCDNAYNKAYDAVELISKAVDVTKWEDGRYYVKKSKTLAQEIIDALDQCAANGPMVEEVTLDDSGLTELQAQQKALEEQQKALKAKEMALKEEMATKAKEKERLKKEAFVKKQNAHLSAFVNSANNILSATKCEDTLEMTEADNSILDLSFEEIESVFKSEAANLAKALADKLKACQ